MTTNTFLPLLISMPIPGCKDFELTKISEDYAQVSNHICFDNEREEQAAPMWVGFTDNSFIYHDVGIRRQPKTSPWSQNCVIGPKKHFIQA